MKKNKNSIHYFLLGIVFLAVPFAVYMKNVPRLVDFIGILISGFAAGTLFSRGISLLKNRSDN